jgi:hypothetical protein
VLALFVAAAAAGGSEFRGCGGAEAPAAADGGTLPEATGGCLVDADCTSDDMCVALECVAGRCVEAGPAMDADADRFPRSPCGEDCDDADPTIFPGAAERCDGVDQDCDGAIDEDAPGIRSFSVDDAMPDARLVGVSDGFLVVGNVTGTGPEPIFGAHFLRPDGTSTAGEQPLGPGPPPEAFALARRGDAVVVVRSAGPDEPPRRLVLTETDGRWSTAGVPEPIGDRLHATRLALAVLGDQEWLLFDTGTGEAEPMRRWLWRSGAPGELIELAVDADDPPPALAHDGTLVAATEGGSTVRFFDAEGADAGAQTLPGPFAAAPLAPADGFVYAAYRDAFDHSMTRVTPDGTTSPITAPSGDREDRVSLFRVGADVLVTRVGGSVRAWLLEADLSSYLASFGPGEVSPIPAPPETVSVGTTDGGLSAILSSYASSSALAVLTCDGP